MASFATLHRRSLLNLGPQPLDDLAKIRIRQFNVCIFRRHLTVAQDIENLQPPFAIAPLHEIRIQSVDAEFSLGLFRTVTRHAGLGEHRCDVLLEICEIGHRRSSRRRCLFARYRCQQG